MNLLNNQRDVWVLNLAARLPQGKNGTAKELVKKYKTILTADLSKKIFDYLMGEVPDKDAGENVVSRAKQLRELAKKDPGRKNLKLLKK